MQIPNEWQTVGMGGLLALLLLREVFSFLGKKKDTAESRAVLREEMRGLFVQVLTDLLKNTLDQQVNICRDILVEQRLTKEGITKLITIYEAKK